MPSDWTVPQLPVSLPTRPVPHVEDVAALKARLQDVFHNIQQTDLVHGAVWRDVFALTGTSRTFYGPASVATAWTETCDLQSAHGFEITGDPVPGGPAGTWLEFPFAFKVLGPPAMTAGGSISLVCNDDGSWQIWMLKTSGEQLIGESNVDVMAPLHDSPPAQADRLHYDCVVLGGGPAGLSVGGRLQTLGVSYVVLDKNTNVGDSWRNRYRSAKLHTIREHAHLPFERTFNASEYPNEYLTKNQLAHGYEAWVSRYKINIRPSTEMIAASWNINTQCWSLELRSENPEYPKAISCSYFVYAAGIGSNIPKMPVFDNRDAFDGVAMHSKQYRDASGWSGKRGVIIGSANTAHDIAEDMLAAKMASVCMVQRSPTLIVNTSHYSAISGGLYNEKLDTAVADRKLSTTPAAVSRLTMIGGLGKMHANDPGYLDGVEDAGFRLDHDSDLMHALLVRRGGHYMDVGGMKNISTGKVRVKSHAVSPKFHERGLIFEDGEILDADVIVFATGFQNDLNPEFVRLFGHDIAVQLEDMEGVDAEGEIKGLYKPTSHPALWVTGGALGQSRFFSRFIALQIKAKLMGTPFQVYNHTP